jgi:hypothetical protein
LAPPEIERQLRSRMTASEYRVLQSRLTGAVKAIATLRERAPDLVPLMFGGSLDQAKTLPLHTQSTLAALIEELLLAATSPDGGKLDRKTVLKLVSRIERSR